MIDGVVKKRSDAEALNTKDVGLQCNFLAETRLLSGTLSDFCRSLFNQLANFQVDHVETELQLFQLSQSENEDIAIQKPSPIGGQKKPELNCDKGKQLLEQIVSQLDCKFMTFLIQTQSIHCSLYDLRQQLSRV